MTRALKLHLGMWWQYLIAAFFAIIFGYPVLWMIYSSFKPTREILANLWSLPTSLSFANYAKVLASDTFQTFYLNSSLLSLITVPLLTLIAAMAAYIFARVPFRGREILFLLFLSGTMIPIHVTLIPLYAMMRDFGLLNKLAALVFPYIGFGLPVSVFILRDFFRQIPSEIEESARLDGCSTARIFTSIALPLARPALMTVVILNLVNVWNEYLFALTFVGGNNSAYTIPIGVVSFVSGLGRVQYDLMLTGLTLAALPVLIFYFFAQRFIIEGITAGSLKG